MVDRVVVGLELVALLVVRVVDRVLGLEVVDLLLVVDLEVGREVTLLLVAERVLARLIDAFRLVVLKTLRRLRFEFLDLILLRPLT